MRNRFDRPGGVDMLEIIAAGLIGVVAGGAIVHVWHYIVALESKLKDTERRIAELTAAQAKRLPYSCADELENSMAAILRLQHETDFRKDLIENALNHLQLARGNGSKKQ